MRANLAWSDERIGGNWLNTVFLTKREDSPKASGRARSQPGPLPHRVGDIYDVVGLPTGVPRSPGSRRAALALHSHMRLIAPRIM